MVWTDGAEYNGDWLNNRVNIFQDILNLIKDKLFYIFFKYLLFRLMEMAYLNMLMVMYLQDNFKWIK